MKLHGYFESRIFVFVLNCVFFPSIFPRSAVGENRFLVNELSLTGETKEIILEDINLDGLNTGFWQ